MGDLLSSPETDFCRAVIAGNIAKAYEKQAATHRCEIGGFIILPNKSTSAASAASAAVDAVTVLHTAKHEGAASTIYWRKDEFMRHMRSRNTRALIMWHTHPPAHAGHRICLDPPSGTDLWTACLMSQDAGVDAHGLIVSPAVVWWYTATHIKLMSYLRTVAGSPCTDRALEDMGKCVEHAVASMCMRLNGLAEGSRSHVSSLRRMRERGHLVPPRLEEQAESAATSSMEAFARSVEAIFPFIQIGHLLWSTRSDADTFTCSQHIRSERGK